MVPDLPWFAGNGHGLLAPYASQVTVTPYRVPCVLRIVILKPLASTSVGSTENPNLSVSRLAPDSMPAIAMETVGLVTKGRTNGMGGDVQIVGLRKKVYRSIGRAADRSGFLGQGIQRGTTASGPLVLWQNPDADLPGCNADDEGEDDRCLTWRTAKPDRSTRHPLSDRMSANTTLRLATHSQ
jgi:hypothetical protein